MTEEALRKTAMQQVDLISTKQRFGYFSIPAPLSIGDTPVGKQRKLDQNGSVITKPRNIYTKPTQSGNSKSSYFNLSKSIYQGDPYMDPGKHERVNNLKRSQQFAQKQKFRPLNSVHKTLLGSSYVHIDQNPIQKNIKQKRDEDGRVIIHPRNVQSSPQSKVVNEIYKHPKFMQSPYDAEKVLRVKENEQGKKKMQQHSFKSTCFQKQYFSTPKDTYGTNINFKQKSPKSSNFNIMAHDSTFKSSGPCNSGPGGCINKFPQHVPCPPKQIKRKPQSQKKDPFKLSAPNKIVTPSPSISFSTSNLRKYVR